MFVSLTDAIPSPVGSVTLFFALPVQCIVAKTGQFTTALCSHRLPPPPRPFGWSILPYELPWRFNGLTSVGMLVWPVTSSGSTGQVLCIPSLQLWLAGSVYRGILPSAVFRRKTAGRSDSPKPNTEGYSLGSSGPGNACAAACCYWSASGDLPFKHAIYVTFCTGISAYSYHPCWFLPVEVTAGDGQLVKLIFAMKIPLYSCGLYYNVSVYHWHFAMRLLTGLCYGDQTEVLTIPAEKNTGIAWPLAPLRAWVLIRTLCIAIIMIRYAGWVSFRLLFCTLIGWSCFSFIVVFGAILLVYSSLRCGDLSLTAL